MSLTSRILLGFLGLALAGWFLILRPVADRVERQVFEAAEEPMVDAAEILAALASAELSEGRDPVPLFQSAFSRTANRTLDARIYSLRKRSVTLDAYLTDASGIVRFDSAHPERVGQDLGGKIDVFLTLRGQYGARSTREEETDPASSIMYVAAPVFHGDSLVGVVSVYKPQRSLLLFVEETRDRLRAIASAAIAAFLLAGLLLSRWVSGPLRRLTDYAREVSTGARIPPPDLPGAQLGVLSRALDSMREALEGRRYVEQFVNHLTHEMKSPLAAIRGAAEILTEDPPAPARKRFLDNITSETHRLQRLIEQLLALASLETRRRIETDTRTDLGELASQACGELRAAADAASVRLQPDLSPAAVSGDPALLSRAIANLLQNAIEFAPADSRIDLRSGATETEAWLQIRDEGPGIPEYALPNLFRRFFSLPRPRTGRKSSGLGLCFVREAAELHRGSVSLSNRPDRTGALAELRLPLAREPRGD